MCAGMGTVHSSIMIGQKGSQHSPVHWPPAVRYAGYFALCGAEQRYKHLWSHYACCTETSAEWPCKLPRARSLRHIMTGFEACTLTTPRSVRPAAQGEIRGACTQVSINGVT